MLNFGEGSYSHVGFEADGTVDLDDRQHLLDCYSGIAFGAGVVYFLQAGAFSYVAANYGTVAFFFEAFHRARSGTAYARLYDVTLAAAVAGSTVNTASATHVRQRSGALTLTDGSTYEAQFGKSGTDAAAAMGGKVVII